MSSPHCGILYVLLRCAGLISPLGGSGGVSLFCYIYPLLPFICPIQLLQFHLSSSNSKSYLGEGSEEISCRTWVDARGGQFGPTLYLARGRRHAADVPDQVVERHLLASRSGQSAPREPGTQDVAHAKSLTLSRQQLTGGLKLLPKFDKGLIRICYFHRFYYLISRIRELRETSLSNLLNY